MQLTLIIHSILLLLASTSFTVVMALFGRGSFTYRFFYCAYRSGFGTKYYSEFTLPEIMTYILAFTFGAVGFAAASRRGKRIVGKVGFAVALIGLFSFVFEASHWFMEHHTSMIAFSPLLMLALVIGALLPNRE